MGNPIFEKVTELATICERNGWTVGFAESCTGGLLSSWLAEVPGVSKFFVGAVVSYARSVKKTVLQVPERSILAMGEVSEPVARAMARGAREALGCSWAVAITGIAGPSGGSLEKPVGTVCFAVSGPGFEKIVTERFPSQLKRHEIQQRAAVFAFDLLVSAVR